MMPRGLLFLIGGAVLAVCATLAGANLVSAQGPSVEAPSAVETLDREACALALDVSGSMAGFYSGGLDTITRLAETLEDRCDETYTVALSTLRSSTSSLGSVRPGTEDTRLNVAIETWLNESTRQRLVLVTDNVADAGNSQKEEAQAQFYALLKDDPSLTHLSMIIMRLPFVGPVYAPGNAASGIYQDDAGRALSVYVLERNGPRQDGNDAFLNAIEGDIQSLGYSRYTGTGEPRVRDYAVARLSPFDPGIASDDSGMEVSVEDGSRNVLISGGKISVRRGASDQGTAFTVGPIKIVSGSDWDLGGAPFSVRYVFPEHEILGPAIQGECDVFPPNADPGTGKAVNIAVTCVVPPVWSGLSQEAQEELAWQGSTVRSGYLELAIDARNTKIILGGPLQQHFGINVDIADVEDGLASSSPDVQSRVYRLQELLDNMISLDDRRVIIRRIDLDVELSHSGIGLLGAILAEGLPWLILLALLGVLTWLALQPVKYRAQTFEGSETFALGFGQEKTLKGAKGERVNLTLLGLALLAGASGKTTVLWRDGGTIKDPSGHKIMTVKSVGSEKRRNTNGKPKRKTPSRSRSRR